MKVVCSERSCIPMDIEAMQEQYETKNPLRSPNQEYLYLTCVMQTKTNIGTNKFYEMSNNGNGTFTATYGRIGDTGRWAARSFVWPMDMWETKFYEKAQLHGYLLVKERKINDKDVKDVHREHIDYSPINDSSVANVFYRLKNIARGIIKDNYTISYTQVCQEQINRAEKLLVCMNNIDEVDEFNKMLMELFAVIPRRIDNLESQLAKSCNGFKAILDREANVLDVMKGQVQCFTKSKKTSSSENITEIESLGLEWREVTLQEMNEIKAHMDGNASQVVNAWRIVNKEQERKYRKFCEENKIKTRQQKFLFHGSRSENFFSIISNSLKINITGVVKTGSMYGNGLYFATLAQKSIGYTSVKGSYWAKGNCNTAFLSIWKVAVGNTYDTYSWNASYGQLSYDKLQMLKKGADSLWAHGGKGCATKNDEVIIYKEEQCTLRYLVEIRQ